MQAIASTDKVVFAKNMNFVLPFIAELASFSSELQTIVCNLVWLMIFWMTFIFSSEIWIIFWYIFEECNQTLIKIRFIFASAKNNQAIRKTNKKWNILSKLILFWISVYRCVGHRNAERRALILSSF